MAASRCMLGSQLSPPSQAAQRVAFGVTRSAPSPPLPARSHPNLPTMLRALRAHLASCTVLAGVVAKGVLGRDTGGPAPHLHAWPCSGAASLPCRVTV